MVKSLSDRNLCGSCGVYDWPWFFREAMLSWPDESLIRNPYANRLPEGFERGTDKTYGGSYRIMPSQTGLPLAKYSSILENQHICTLCKLIVRGATPYLQKSVRNQLEDEEKSVSALFPSGPLSRPDRILFQVSIRAWPDEEKHEDRSVLLNFTLQDNGDPKYNTLKTRNVDTTFWVRKPIKQHSIDMEVIKDWLRDCNNTHPSCRDPFSSIWNDIQGERGLKFRVIDVINNEIVVPAFNSRYVALSYVWGDAVVHRTQRRDFQQRPDPDDSSSMTEYVPLANVTLPQTILDAMIVVRDIGERYIWVDALCIAQDDLAELEVSLKAMCNIYENAVLTIVAASGTAADSGLPGIGPTSRNIVSVTGTIEDIPLIGAEPTFELDRTPWATRGWTFQEQLYSNCCLVFGNDRVFYSCLKGSRVEARPLDVEPSQLRSETFHQDRSIGPATKHHFADFVWLLRRYTKRNLSHDSDILAAFLGTIDRLGQISETRFCWGLPLKPHFTISLFWKASHGQNNQQIPPLRRREVCYPGGPGAAAVSFPSWSWTGWIGAVEYGVPGYVADHVDRVKSAVLWPWDYEPPLTDTEKDAFEKGILTFKARVATIDRANLGLPDPGRALWLDDGTIWETGEKVCVLLAHSTLGPWSHCFLATRRGENGILYREGQFATSKGGWDAATPETLVVSLG